MPGHWTSKEDVSGDRAKRAIAYGDTMQRIVNGESDESFDALLPLIDPERFVRRGNERDQEMDWPTYRAMLEGWNAGSGRYEKTLHRASEAGNVVYLDLDERNVAKDGTASTLRSVSIYEFDEADRIVAVDICMGFHR